MTGSRPGTSCLSATSPRAHELALAASGPVTVNISSEEATTVNELFRLMAAETYYVHPPVHENERPGEIKHVVLANTRAKRLLGLGTRDAASGRPARDPCLARSEGVMDKILVTAIRLVVALVLLTPFIVMAPPLPNTFFPLRRREGVVLPNADRDSVWPLGGPNTETSILFGRPAPGCC